MRQTARMALPQADTPARPNGRGTVCRIVAREHFSLRLDVDTKRALEREAQRRGLPKTVLAEQLLSEAVRTLAHPGIVFRDGALGRRPALVRGPDVWEVVMVWMANDRDVRATADYLEKPIGLIEAALGYYADHQAEIDEWLEANDREMTEGYAAWLRRQAIAPS